MRGENTSPELIRFYDSHVLANVVTRIGDLVRDLVLAQNARDSGFALDNPSLLVIRWAALLDFSDRSDERDCMAASCTADATRRASLRCDRTSAAWWACRRSEVEEPAGGSTPAAGGTKPSLIGTPARTRLWKVAIEATKSPPGRPSPVGNLP